MVVSSIFFEEKRRREKANDKLKKLMKYEALLDLKLGALRCHKGALDRDKTRGAMRDSTLVRIPKKEQLGGNHHEEEQHQPSGFSEKSVAECQAFGYLMGMARSWL